MTEQTPTDLYLYLLTHSGYHLLSRGIGLDLDLLDTTAKFISNSPALLTKIIEDSANREELDNKLRERFRPILNKNLKKFGYDIKDWDFLVQTSAVLKSFGDRVDSVSEQQ